MHVNYKTLYRNFVIALCRKTNVLFAFNADRKLVEHLSLTAVTLVIWLNVRRILSVDCQQAQKRAPARQKVVIPAGDSCLLSCNV